MQRSGTNIFSDAHDYEASIRGAKVNLVFSCQKNFQARLTWVDLRCLRLIRGQEDLPRVAHVSLIPDLVFFSFPIRYVLPVICNGLELERGEIVFHRRGERVHQRIRGPSQWGFISLAPEHLGTYGRALAGYDLVAPSVARVLRPSHLDANKLLRLHASACRLAETRPKMLAHAEVVRALEQELLHTLVNCLTSNDAHDYSASKQNHLKIIDQFEDVLAAHTGQQLKISKLCAAIGATERTVRTCCEELLGMGPNRYFRLRRLNLVRAALQHSSPSTTVEELARRYGFSELGRFAALYRAVFGETPLTTLRSAQITRP